MAGRNRGRFKVQYFEAARQPAVMELFRDYDSALCRAATEGQDKHVLKEKVNNAARIACKSFEGKYAMGMARRLSEISEDEMAIQENLLFVLDSIMRHATRDSPKTAKRFEKAFSPILVQLFRRALRRLESREAVANYLKSKLLPTWKDNRWFAQELPKVQKVLDQRREEKVSRKAVREVVKPYSPVADVYEDEGEVDFTEWADEPTEGAPWEPAYDAFATRSPYTEPPPDELEEVAKKDEDLEAAPTSPVASEEEQELYVPTEVAPSTASRQAPTVPQTEEIPLYIPTRGVPTQAELQELSMPVPTPAAESSDEEAVAVPQDMTPALPGLVTPRLPGGVTPRVPVDGDTPLLPGGVTPAMAPVDGGATPGLPPAYIPMVPVVPAAPPVTEPPPSTEVPPTEASTRALLTELPPAMTEELPPETEPSRPAPTRTLPSLDEPTVSLPSSSLPTRPSAHTVDSEMTEMPPPTVSVPAARSAAPSSPTEVPVPTDAAPTSPAVSSPMDLDMPAPPGPVPGTPTEPSDAGVTTIPGIPIPGRRTRTPTRRSTTQPSSPVEMPVPTEVGAESEPPTPAEMMVLDDLLDAALEGDAVPPSDPTVTVASSSQVPVQQVSKRGRSRTPAPSSPTEVPVPTEAAPSDDEDAGIVGYSMPPVPRSVPSVQRPQPTEPSEMPVPTEAASPTSMAGMDDDTALAQIEAPPPLPIRSDRQTRRRHSTTSPTEMPIPPPAPRRGDTLSPTQLPTATEVGVPPPASRRRPAPSSPTHGVPPFRRPSTVAPTDVPTDTALMVPTELPSTHAGGVRTGRTRRTRPTAPSSPTEMPVPTEQPSPTSPAPLDEEDDDVSRALRTLPNLPPRGVVVVPTSPRSAPTRTPATIPPPGSIRSVPPVLQRTRTRPTAPSSPTEMPVPTEQPSPTSPAPIDQDIDMIQQAPLPAQRPPPTEPVAVEEDVIPAVPARQETRARTRPAPSSPTHATEVPPPVRRPTIVVRSRQAPSSPTEMPVPTEQPSPTSPAPMESEAISSEMMTYTEGPPATVATTLPAHEHTPTELPVPPTLAVPSEDAVPSTIPVPSTVPVPTAVPTQPSPADFAHQLRGVRPTLEPSRADTGVTAEVDDEVPQFRASAAGSSAADTVGDSSAVPPLQPAPASPTEMPGPPTHVRHGRLGVPTRERSRHQPTSPTEMPVPTELPSPTSPGGVQDEEEETGREITRPPAVQPAAAAPRDVVMQDVEVEEDVIPAVPARQETRVRSRPAPSSPTENIRPPERAVRSRPAPSSPTQAATEGIQPPIAAAIHRAQGAVHSRGSRGTRQRSRGAPSSPTEMPVPTEMPSPTSPAPMEADLDVELLQAPPVVRTQPTGSVPEPDTAEEVAVPSLPAGLPARDARTPVVEVEAEIGVPPPVQAPPMRDAPTDTEPPIPPVAPVRRQTIVVRSRNAPSSPTEMPVPTEMPSPTSPAPMEPEAPSPEGTTYTEGPPATVATTLPPPEPTPTELPVPPTATPPRSEGEPTVVPSTVPVPTAVPTGGVDDEVPVPQLTVPTGSSIAASAGDGPAVPPLQPAPASPTEIPGPPTHVRHGRIGRSISRSRGQPTSPTEMPVPTMMPSPTSPGGVQDEEDEETGRELTRPPAAQATASAPQDAVMQDVEVPQLTQRPARPPVDVASVEQDMELAVPEPLPSSAVAPLRAAPTSPTEIQPPVPAAAGAPQRRAGVPTRSRGEPTSPTEMPVPTELPSPTSPAAGAEDSATDAETVQELTRPPAARHLQAPAPQEPEEEELMLPPPAPPQRDARTPRGDVGTEEVELAVPPAQAQAALRPAPSSPSEVQPLVPAAAGLSRQRAGRSTRSRAQTSPTEMPMPTELPSPTSPGPAEEEDGTDAETAQELTRPPVVPHLDAQVPHEPEEELMLPPPAPPQRDARTPRGDVGTEEVMLPPPAPPQRDARTPRADAGIEEVPPPSRTARGRGAHSRTAPSSPTEMPMPTELPSPTSLAPMDEETDEEPLPPLVEEEPPSTIPPPPPTMSEEPPSTVPPPTHTHSTVAPTLEPPTMERTMEPPTMEPLTDPTAVAVAGAQEEVPPLEAAPQLVLMLRFPDAPYPPPPKFKTELIRSLRALGATNLSDLSLRLREGLLAEVRGPEPALVALHALQLRYLPVLQYRVAEVQGPGTEASLKWFRQQARAPPAPPAAPTAAEGVAPSPSTALEPGLEHPSVPTLLSALPSPHSAVTRPHSHTPGFTRPSPLGQQSPTEIFSLQPEAAAAGTPTGRTTRGFKAPAPGTPTYSPTEFFAEPATPQEGVVARALKRARAPSAEREGMSSPTYLAEVSEMPLPPTPTYSAGSSPTYVEENEPATPTLEADDDEFGDDLSVADWVQSATPKVIQGGTPQSIASGTPSRQPVTPVNRLSAGNLARQAFSQQMRLPGMESPTPTYEPDDETVYGDDASSVASWVASATPRGYDGTNTPMSLPGTPLSYGPGTPLAAAGTPGGGTPHGIPSATGQPSTPVGEDVPAGFAEPGTPTSAAAGTPQQFIAAGTPEAIQPGTPQEVLPTRRPPPPPATPPPPMTGVRPPPPPPPGVRPPIYSASASSSAVGLPTAPPPPPSSAAPASSLEPPAAPGMPALASEVFGERGKRKRGDGAASDEELPPWKRRAQRRKKQ